MLIKIWFLFFLDSREHSRTAIANSGSPSLFNFDTSCDIYKIKNTRRGSSFQSHFKPYRTDQNIKSNDNKLLTPFMLQPIPDKSKSEENIDGIGNGINKEEEVLNTNIPIMCEKNFIYNICEKVVSDECFNDIDTVPEIQETSV